ncbi:MAG: Na+/H+ antiporter NhaA [Pseudonocardiaceae bacterium]
MTRGGAPMAWFGKAVDRACGADEPHDKRATRVEEFARFLRTETVGGTLLLSATVVALIWANSPLRDVYTAVRDHRIGPAALHLDLTLGTWASDGLLAVFFFVAGLELKRELVVGELSDRRSATLPLVAALGGMLVPALLALAVSAGAPGAAKAWAIPVATDIAFALGVLAVTGSALPTSARLFLLSLAVVDDLGAILVIAVLFTSGVHLLALGTAVALCTLYWWLQRRRIRSSWSYVPLAALTWYAVHEAGVHATVAGIALGLLTRVRPDPGEAKAPALRLEHRIQPFSAAVAVPVFAVFAAGVPIGLDTLVGVATDRIALAIIVGLLAGKLIGIFGAAWLAIRVGIAAKPRGLAWRDLAAVSILGGVGFTVSLLIAELSLTGAAAQRAKVAVLLASATASLVGAVALLHRSRAHQNG